MDILVSGRFARRFCARLIVRISAALCLLAGTELLTASDVDGEFFEKQVRPILVARCLECHSGKSAKIQGGLRLDSRAAALQGGDTGPAVVPGKPKESLLIDAINYGELYQMPPKGKLPADEVAVLTKWIEHGAPWPQAAADEAAGHGVEKVFDLAKRKAEHWCWQPIQSSSLPPDVKNPALATEAIDRFVLAKLEANGLTLAPPAEMRTLIAQ